ncbi:MAG: ABC transporter permease [Chloroflexi bacterium]|nr:ABC transporter permease [Chloroflexota bacterium]
MLARRLTSSVLVLVGVIVSSFVALRLVPGDPIATMLSRASLADPAFVARFRAEYGLDEPLPIQLVAWLGHVLTGDLGTSIVSGEPVAELIWRRLLATLLLGGAAAVIAFPGGILWGIAAARSRGVLGGFLGFQPLLGLTIPPFSIGLVLIFVFAVELKVLPSSGMMSKLDGGSPGDVLAHLVLPAVTLAIYPAAMIARITQAGLQEVTAEDYVRTARAIGIPSRRITYRHALPNALLPVITAAGVLLGYLLAGAVFVESVFNWPGLGTLIVRAVLNRDYPIVQACSIVVAVAYVSLSLGADLLYMRVDPRIRFQGSTSP